MNTIVNGARIRLRPYRDYEEYRAWRAMEAREDSPFWGPQNIAEGLDRRAFMPGGLFMEDYGCFAVEELATGRHIGNEYWHTPDGFQASAMLGTRIHPELRGQGFGVEAKRLAMGWLFGNFPLRLVTAETMDDHRAARRSLELAGLRLCGIRPCEEFSRGQWHGVAYYGISREEWKEGFRF